MTTITITVRHDDLDRALELAYEQLDRYGNRLERLDAPDKSLLVPDMFALQRLTDTLNAAALAA